ncbi:MAG TPA: chitobiase/beta-hexosaminidase C-terminal domain-containing protein, partial [Candidatus Cloacimonadota bacterium]|nr:chitobiase/beta-hexosaminidase C-terminal domain-containing protein [Candidatus Cloacimonadota bacterium]
MIKFKQQKIKQFLLILFLLLLITGLHAQVNNMVSWNFDNQTMEPSSGTGSLSLIGNTTASYATGFDGSASNGFALNTATYPVQGTGNQTAGIQAMVSTVGMQDLAVVWFQRNSGTAANRTRLQYTRDGTNWIDFQATPQNAVNVTSNGTDTGFDNGLFIASEGSVWYIRGAIFTGMGGTLNNPNFGVRIVSAFLPGTETYVATGLTSTYGTGGTHRIDNLTIGQINSETVSPPVITPNGGTFTTSVEVTLQSSTAGAQIYYTVNGTDPVPDQVNLYLGPFMVSESCQVRAIAYVDTIGVSSITTADFIIEIPMNHFAPIWTGSPLQPMTFYVSLANIYGTDLSTDDEIAVYDGANCVGVARLTSSVWSYPFDMAPVVTSMDNPATPEIDGFTPGNQVSFRTWQHNSSVELTSPRLQITYLQGQPIFQADTTAQVEIVAANVMQYQLALIAYPSEGGTTQGSGMYNAGDLVYAYAYPNEGYVFDYWANADGDMITYDNPYTFNMPGISMALQAHFRQTVTGNHFVPVWTG